MNQCHHPRDFTLHSAGRPTLKEASTFGDVLALPEEFLDSEHERDDADNDELLCRKEGNLQTLEEPKFGRNASGYQRRDAISGERQKVGGRAA